MAVWLVRAGKYGDAEQTAIEKGVVTIGWNELPDLSTINDREALADLYRKLHPDASGGKVANHVGQVWAFRSRIKKDDLVVLPLKSRSAIAIGKMVGPYQFASDMGDGIRHVRKVEWLRTDIPRTAFDQDILHSLGAFMTVCQIERNNAEERIKAVLNGKKAAAVATTAADDLEDDAQTLDIEQAAGDQILEHIQRHFAGHKLATFLLFLKMADEQTKPPYNKPPVVPAKYGWESLLKREGDDLEAHYRHVLEELGRQPGMLGEIFKKARPEIQNPATLRRLIVDLIEPVKWSSMQADVKGDIYEGLLAKSAAESPKGAGQYFTPRELIKAIVDCVQPTADDTVCDPAAGTGGFLLAAYDYVAKHQGSTLDKDQKRHLRTKFVKGWELVPNTARLCIMNLYLHGIDADPCPIRSGVDALASDPGERFSVVLTNPPFGKKSTIAVVNDAGDLEKEDTAYERQDFWTTTKNKQLNFVQHVRTLLKVNGRCAVVVPDNVLFEGGAGETVRRNLLKQCDVHTLLRLPTGIFYAQGVKANVLFLDAKPAQEKLWTTKLWVYDLRTNMHFTQKTNPLRRADLDEFVECYRPGKRHLRKATWGEATPEGRWRAFDYDALLKRDKVNLDIFWLRDKSLEDTDDLPTPDVLAQEIADDLQTALEQFTAIAEKVKG